MKWLRDFPRHWRSIRWYVRVDVDIWHWGLGFRIWYDAAPGFHFDSTGISFHAGPLHAEAGGKDTN